MANNRDLDNFQRPIFEGVLDAPNSFIYSPDGSKVESATFDPDNFEIVDGVLSVIGGGGGGVTVGAIDYQDTHSGAILQPVGLSVATEVDFLTVDQPSKNFNIEDGLYLIEGDWRIYGGSGTGAVEVNVQGDGGSFQFVYRPSTNRADSAFSFSKVVRFGADGVDGTDFEVQSVAAASCTVEGKLTFIKIG